MPAKTPSVFKINDLTKGHPPDADLEDFALLSVDRTEETNEGRIHIGLPDMVKNIVRGRPGQMPKIRITPNSVRRDQKHRLLKQLVNCDFKGEFDNEKRSGIRSQLAELERQFNQAGATEAERDPMGCARTPTARLRSGPETSPPTRAD